MRKLSDVTMEPRPLSMSETATACNPMRELEQACSEDMY